ncbi:MAG: hypothetical protein JRI52_07110 [Deltaproteobacteria bacterium]|nr:hypothetical protein [Deltaproteobacteria bacterium]
MYRNLNPFAFQYSGVPIGTKPLGLCLIAILCSIILTNCAIIPKHSYQEPLSYDEVKNIIEKVQDQGKKVSSFYSFGSLSVKDGNWESESNILTVGTNNPFLIKIEITHPWGQPILHILIGQIRLEVLSFREKRFYFGTFTPEALSRFFPVDFNTDLIWAALRGYPNIIRHHRIAFMGRNKISLLNEEEKEIEIINLYPENLLPKLVSFPEKNICLAFSSFQEDKGIIYAKKVKVDMVKRDVNLVLKNRKMVFNKMIPEQVFVIKKPPSFKTFYLDENGGEESQ